MAHTAESVSRRYTAADLAGFPDDNNRYEIIDGELFVTPAPLHRHQRAVLRLSTRLLEYADRTGGEAICAPWDVHFAIDSVVEPDVVFLRHEHLDRIRDGYLYGAPDLAVEVLSPGTRKNDRGRKRDLYARFAVPEYWIVDLDNRLVEQYLLVDGTYGKPAIYLPGESIKPAGLAGLEILVTEALGEKPAS